jgi:hypothetical protein
MAKFGSMAWQEEKTRTVLAKLLKGEKLTDEEKTFSEIQLEHNLRNKTITKSQYNKGLKALRKVM